MRIAAVGDLHCGPRDQERIRERLGRVHEEAELLVLAGDLTNYGRPEELQVLIGQLLRLRLPIVSVLGNHDYESGQQDKLLAMLREVGIKPLDEEPYARGDIGFAGVKGFGGGFDRGELTSFGEPEIKSFVAAAVREAMQLEKSFSLLRASRRVAVMHYAPIAATAVGERPEIFPFLGSSRLADVCDRFQARAVFHGHAHHGSLEGRTRGGAPVYNVAEPLLMRQSPPMAYRVVEI